MTGIGFKTKKEALRFIHQLRKKGIKTKGFYLQGLRYLVTY